MTLLYDTALPIRPEIIAAQAAVVDTWRRPGTWWSGAERREIVNQVRAARDLGAGLPAWSSPVADGIAPDSALPDAAVTAIWRLTNHPGTLTLSWYESIVPTQLDAGSYAELVAVVSQVNNIDRFADALSLARPSLADPVDGEPSRTTPDDLNVSTHWVPTVAGPGPNVQKALSSVPAEVEAWQLLSHAQYVPDGALLGDLGSPHGALERIQIELVAARTSKLNECFY